LPKGAAADLRPFLVNDREGRAVTGSGDRGGIDDNGAGVANSSYPLARFIRV